MKFLILCMLSERLFLLTLFFFWTVNSSAQSFPVIDTIENDIYCLYDGELALWDRRTGKLKSVARLQYEPESSIIKNVFKLKDQGLIAHTNGQSHFFILPYEFSEKSMPHNWKYKFHPNTMLFTDNKGIYEFGRENLVDTYGTEWFGDSVAFEVEYTTLNTSGDHAIVFDQKNDVFLVDLEKRQVTESIFTNNDVDYAKGLLSGKFSPDDHFFTILGKKGRLSTIDLENKRVIYIKNITKSAYEFRYTDNGKYIVPLDNSNELRLIDSKTGEAVRTIEFDQKIHHFECSPDGIHALVGTKHMDLFYVNLETGEIKWKLDFFIVEQYAFGFLDGGNEIYATKFNKNVPEIYSKDKEHLKTYELGLDLTAQISTDVNEKLRVGIPRGHTQEITDFQFSPDSRLVLTYSTDNTAIIWDVESQKSMHILTGKEGDFLHVEFNSDGTKILANSKEGVVRVWDTRSGKQVLELKSEYVKYYEAHFNLRGENVITRTVANNGVAMNHKKPSEIYITHESYEFEGINLYNLDGSLYYTATDYYLPAKLDVYDPMEILLVQNWDISNGKAINYYVDFDLEDPFSLEISTTTNPNLIYLAPNYVDYYGEGEGFLIDLSSMTKLTTFYMKAISQDANGHEFALFVPYFNTTELQFWDITDGKLLQKIKFKTEEPESIQLDLDLYQCIVSSWDHGEIYDLNTGEFIQNIEEDKAWDLTESKERLAKAEKSVDKIILDDYVINLETGDTLLADLPSGTKFSPDSKQVAYIDNLNGNWGLQIIDLSSKQEKFLSKRSSEFSFTEILPKNDQLLLIKNDHFKKQRTTQFIDIHTGKITNDYTNNDPDFHHKDFDASGERELRASFSQAKIYDLKSGELLMKSPNAIDDVKILELNDDYICLMKQTAGKQYGSTEIIELKTNKVIKDLGYNVWRVEPKLSASGRFLIIKGGSEKLYDTQNEFKKVWSGYSNAKWSEDLGTFNEGETVFIKIFNNEIELIDTKNGELIWKFLPDFEVKKVLVSKDQKRCLAINDSKVIIYNIEERQVVEMIECVDGTNMTLILEDDHEFVTKLPDETLVRFRLKDGSRVEDYSLEKSRIKGCFINSDLQRVVLYSDSTAELKDYLGNKLLQITPDNSENKLITKVSKDGKTLISYEYNGETVKLYSRLDGSLIKTIRKKDWEGEILNVIYISDSLYLIQKKAEPVKKVGSGDQVFSSTLELDDIYSDSTLWKAYISNQAKIQFALDSTIIYYNEGSYGGVTWFYDLMTHAPYYSVDGAFFQGKERWYSYKDGNLNYIDNTSLDTIHSEKYLTGFQDAFFTENVDEIYLRKDQKGYNNFGEFYVLDNFYLERWNLKTGAFLGYYEYDYNLYQSTSKLLRSSIDVSIDGAEISVLENGLQYALKGHEGNILKLFGYSENRLISTAEDGSIIIWDMDNKSMLLKSIMFDNDPNMWVHIHASGAFDASPGAMELMYWTKGLEVIDFAQLKDRYWIPGIWEKVMNNESLPTVKNIDELKLQPKVTLGTIKDGRIPVTLAKREGGYGDVSIFINGKEMISDARGDDFDPTKDEQTIYIQVDDHPFLQNGENEIMVKASSEDGFVQGRGDALKFILERKELEKPSFYGVIIGVDDYVNDDIDLKYPSKDARSIAKAVELGAENLFGTDKHFVYTITSDGDVRPNKENIKNVFTEIAAKANSQDVIMIYLSGHGVTWGGENESDFFFLTADATAAHKEAYNDPVIRANSTISTAELVDWIKTIPALKQVMIIDACGSGKAVDNLIAARDVDASQIKAIDRMRDRTGMFVISGCTADAVSYEASQYGQGLLTYSILQAMKGAALKEDKYVDVFTILEHARETVPTLASGLGGIQEPQFLHPKGGSFDIGLLNDEDKLEIPLEEPKMIFVRSSFFNLEEMEDDLELSALVDQKLSFMSSKGDESKIVFFDTKKYPNSCKISGGYAVDGEEITLTLKIRCKQETSETKLKAKSAEELIELITKHVQEL